MLLLLFSLGKDNFEVHARLSTSTCNSLESICNIVAKEIQLRVNRVYKMLYERNWVTTVEIENQS
jgi:hypothetical protein